MIFLCREKNIRPWLMPPQTEFRLQNRVPGHDDQVNNLAYNSPAYLNKLQNHV